MPFACARCGHVSRDPDEIRESYCASCGDWSPNAAARTGPAPEPESAANLADLEYQCRGCGIRFWVPGARRGLVLCTCGEERPCLPAEPSQVEVTVRHAELLGYPVDLVTNPALQPGYIVVGTMDYPDFGWLMAGRSTAELEAGFAALGESLARPLVPLADWSVTLRGQVLPGDQLSLLAGLGQARPDQVPEILAAGRRLEEAVAASGVTWYQRARSAAAALIMSALHSIGLPRFPVVPERSGTETDDDHEAWRNPYEWRPGDPEL